MRRPTVWREIWSTIWPTSRSQARPTSMRYRIRKFLRRNKGPALAAALVLAAVLAGSAVSVWQAVRATAAENNTRKALTQAQEELATREAVQQFLLDKMFAAGRPLGEDGGLGPNVSLRQAIDAAVPAVGEAFRDRPAVEAAVRQVLGDTYYDPRRMVAGHRAGSSSLAGCGRRPSARDPHRHDSEHAEAGQSLHRCLADTKSDRSPCTRRRWLCSRPSSASTTAKLSRP